MDELITWLRAQLDDDERVVREACLHIDDCGYSGFADRFAGDRLLAEAEAKRERLDWIEGELRDDDTDESAQWLAKLEARPYVGRDGWREEWVMGGD